MLVAECLTSLLFPFQWTLLYVPIVFTAALVCLDVPVPAIMGLHINKSNDNDDDDGSSDTSDEATFEVQKCVVHIDKGEIQLPDDMPRFPDRSCFIDELNEILSRFENYLNIDLSKNDLNIKQRIIIMKMIIVIINVYVYLMNLNYVKFQRIIVYVHHLSIVLPNYLVKWMHLYVIHHRVNIPMLINGYHNEVQQKILIEQCLLLINQNHMYLFYLHLWKHNHLFHLLIQK
jgi:hypothetical protein